MRQVGTRALLGLVGFHLVTATVAINNSFSSGRARQNPGCNAASGLLAPRGMLEQRYYDAEQTIPIPDAPRAECEDPQSDKFHLEFHITGEYGEEESPQAKPRAYYPPEFDATISIHKQGTHPLEDPSAKVGGNNKFVKGCKVDTCQDGHGQYMRRLTAMARDEKALANALKGLVEAIDKAIHAARRRRKAPVHTRAKKTTFVHRGRGNFRCRKGRHRSGILAGEGRKVARAKGCTVTIHCASLWSGTHDPRGPCGCHNQMRVYAQWMSRPVYAKWSARAKVCKAEAGRRFEYLLKPFLEAHSDVDGHVEGAT